MSALKTSTALLLAAALLFQAACTAETPEDEARKAAEREQKRRRDISWKEQVKLQDGRVILIRHTVHARFTRDELSDRGGYETIGQDIEVLDAAGLDMPPKWSDKWKPMILDKDPDGTWFMVVTLSKCFPDWQAVLPYRKYRAVNGKWEQVEYVKIERATQPLTEENFDLSLIGRAANINWLVRYTGMPETLYLRDKPFHPQDDGTPSESRRIMTGISSTCT